VKKKSFRTISLLLVSVMLLMVGAGCSNTAKTSPSPAPSGNPSAPVETPNSGPVSGGVLYMSREGTMTETNLYPHMKLNTKAYLTMAPAIEKLFILDDKGNMLPQLAESWDVSDDNLTYTFHLVKGAKFHDGTDFNAEAAMWNLQKAKDNAAETNASNADIASMKAIDANTLEVKFSKMYATLFLSFDAWIISPKAFEDNGQEWCAKNPIGTGPFKYDHWTLDSELVYVKNENYRLPGLPYLDGVTFKIIKDNTVLSASLKNGEVDVVTEISSAELIDAFKTQPDVSQVVSEQKAGVVSLMPCGLSTSPLKNATVRKALAYAIDLDAIISSVFDETNIATNQLASPGSIFYSDKVVTYDYSPEKAKELLKEAGYGSGGKKLEVELVTESQPGPKLMCEAIQAQLIDVGVDCKITVLEAASYFEKVIISPWEDDWVVLMGTTYNAYCPLTGVDRLMGANHAKMLPSVFFPDEWVNNIVKAAAQPTLEEAAPYYHAAQEVFFNDYCGFLGVRSYGDMIYLKNYVHGFDIHNQPYQFGVIWKSAK